MEVFCSVRIRRVFDLTFERSGKQVPVTERTITIGGGRAPEPGCQAPGMVRLKIEPSSGLDTTQTLPP